MGPIRIHSRGQVTLQRSQVFIGSSSDQHAEDRTAAVAAHGCRLMRPFTSHIRHRTCEIYSFCNVFNASELTWHSAKIRTVPPKDAGLENCAELQQVWCVFATYFSVWLCFLHKYKSFHLNSFCDVAAIPVFVQRGRMAKGTIIRDVLY